MFKNFWLVAVYHSTAHFPSPGCLAKTIIQGLGSWWSVDTIADFNESDKMGPAQCAGHRKESHFQVISELQLL